ncbi:MAG: FAD-binding protein [Alphaproteobacteria bacterium]|nr:FAD-binding protein [Alphaproteobacteria bacterium]
MDTSTNKTSAGAALARVKEALAARFGNRYSEHASVREQHGHTLTWTPNQPPDAVLFAQTTQEVAEIIKLCADHRVPVIPFGTGTSLEGHTNAPRGGICIDLSQMKRIIAVHPEDLDVVVEAGVTRKELNDHLRDTGLFFPIDPGADASIGGMVSTRASGTNAVRYGTMKDNVLALTVVTAQGEIIRTGSRAKKSSAGYDLTRLFTGAEGTLGVITEITLRLHGQPEAVAAAACAFPDVRACCDVTIAAIQSGIPVARIELLDALLVKAVNLHSGLGLPERPMLLLEFHGSETGVKEQVERFGEIAREYGGGDFQWATKPEDRSKLWQARHDAYWACFTLRPGAKAIATDICVPISRLAECVSETQQDIAQSRLVSPIVGHVGDGNFHLNLLVDMNDADEVRRTEAFLERLVRRGLAMEGTCTGEHGIGQAKMKYMSEEHDAGALAAMRALKAALDPLDIMNPGKMLPGS